MVLPLAPQLDARAPVALKIRSPGTVTAFNSERLRSQFFGTSRCPYMYAFQKTGVAMSRMRAFTTLVPEQIDAA